MDKEILDAIRTKLEETKNSLEIVIDQLDDVEEIESPSTGKIIAVDFDDTDLTNVQATVDAAASQLQELSAQISSYLQ